MALLPLTLTVHALPCTAALALALLNRLHTSLLVHLNLEVVQRSRRGRGCRPTRLALECDLLFLYACISISVPVARLRGRLHVLGAIWGCGHLSEVYGHGEPRARHTRLRVSLLQTGA